MIIPLDKIVNDYGMNIRGVLHVGAHYGQEYQDYVRQGIKNLVFFEPSIPSYKELLKTLPKKNAPHKERNQGVGIKTFNIALGNEVGEKELYVETVNRGMSNSLLKPGTHLTLYPGIKFDKKETVKIDKLDNIEFDRSLYNMINIDVQGYELEVFRGAQKTLQHIDIIYTEINLEQVYEGCCQVEDLDKFLGGFGFVRILTKAPNKTWGDALYLKYE